MGRSNKEAREDSVADTDQVKRGLKSIRGRRQQLDDMLDEMDPVRKKKKKEVDEEESD